jgi:hypothetical protein
VRKVLLAWGCWSLLFVGFVPAGGSGPIEATAGPVDTDGDGVIDDREHELGLDPGSADTDGDGIGDRLELDGGERGFDLSGSDPARKDLYVTVYVLADQHSYRDQQRKALAEAKDAFATMPVENPDGSEGITLHLSVEYVDRSSEEVATAGSKTTERIELADLRAEFDAEGPEHVLVVTSPEYVDGYAGEAALGGRYGMVGVVSEHVVVHELLHNVVGTTLSGGECGAVHTCEGYLSDGRANELGEPTREAIEKWGFATELVTATGPSRR